MADFAIDTTRREDEEAGAIAEAAPWRLIVRAFFRHRLAVVGLVVLAFIYFVALFAEFLSPSDPTAFNADYAYAPPQAVHLGEREGGWGLYVHAYDIKVDPDTYEFQHVTNADVKIPLGFFVKGFEYHMFGLIPWDRHLFGPINSGEPVYLIGGDRNGRDLLSRTIYGTRVSMTVGLVGVFFAFLLGMTLGGISGYFGGITDNVIQRIVEFFMSIPTLPLWLGLTAALPKSWSPTERYIAITIILAIVAWTDLARVVRGRFISLRGEDFVTAARLDGNSQASIIFRHMMPSFSSHLIASLTLSIPNMILAETALSFLGLGLLPPSISWGVLLQEAQNVRAVATAPWLMLPAVAVVVAVLSLNFVGDGLRDAADPYNRG
jgi:peptide/nickel transport system permease protein